MGDDPHLQFGDNFWSDFFLLKPKTAHLEAETAKLSQEQFLAARPNLNRLFEESLGNLECRERPIRIVYALHTLCGLVKAVFKKHQAEAANTAAATPTASSSSSQNATSTGGSASAMGLSSPLDVVINCLVGVESAEHRMAELMSHLNSFLIGEHPSSLKELCLKLLLIICTGVDNVSRNTLVEYIMINSVFESLVHLLSDAESRSLHGHSCILILTLLVQYRKYEAANPYVVKLSILDQEMSLLGYSNVITNTLASYTAQYEATHEGGGGGDQTTSGGGSWLGSIASMVGSMFVSEEVQQVRVEQMRARNAVLLALYEAVHLNRNFIATLAHYQTELPSSKQIGDPSSSSGENSENVDLNELSSAHQSADWPAAQTCRTADNQLVSRPAAAVGTSAADAQLLAANAGGGGGGGRSPSNLLVTFLEYCSIAMQDIKSESSQNTVKLSFLILTCITEDQYANALLNDPNLVFKVRLHRAPMRHRKAGAGAGGVWEAGAH